MAAKAEDILEQLGGAQTAESAVRTREALPDMEAHNPTLRWMVHLGAPLIASVIAHVSLFVALGLARWDLGSARPVADYNAGITEAQPDEGFKWPTETPQDKSETPDDWPTDVAKIENLETPQTPDANVTSEASGGGFGDIGSLGTSGVIGMGSGMGEGGGRGGPGEGFGARGGATIFNFSADGSKFVYVLDFSGSVIVAVDDLKRELKRSVASLQASNEFNVILFYEQVGTGKLMVDGFQSALTPATGPNKQSFFDWISKKAPNGGTAPVDALKRAIAMKPDAVFFFSDGGFDNEVLSTISKANGRKVQINCLVFDEILINDRSGLPKVTDGAKRMQKLADENRGKCKIVTGRDIEKGAKGAK